MWWLPSVKIFKAIFNETQQSSGRWLRRNRININKNLWKKSLALNPGGSEILTMKRIIIKTPTPLPTQCKLCHQISIECRISLLHMTQTANMRIYSRIKMMVWFKTNDQITTCISLKLIWIGVERGMGSGVVLYPKYSSIRKLLRLPKFHRTTFWHLYAKSLIVMPFTVFIDVATRSITIMFLVGVPSLAQYPLNYRKPKQRVWGKSSPT